MRPKRSRRNDRRTTISLAKVVWEMAEEMMREKGFNDNFSSYVADLIRRDRERAKASREGGPCPAATFPRPGRMELRAP